MEQLLTLLQELHPEVDFATATNLVEEQVLTSLDIIAIISELNAAFDIEVPAEEILPENFSSAQAIWEMAQRLMDED